MRRHEIDRGSDIDFNTAHNSLKSKRELFIKDGNVEILQLMTRDKTRDGLNLDDDNIYVNVPVKPAGNPQAESKHLQLPGALSFSSTQITPE